MNDHFEKPSQYNHEGPKEELKFQLNKTPEGREIGEKLETEYSRRVAILKDVVNVLDIPEDLIILAPPVLDRTDFGYIADIDMVFLGTSEQRDELYQRLYGAFEIFPSIVYINPSRLTEIENELPELYHFLMQRKGNIPSTKPETEIISKNFWGEISHLEVKTRDILTPEEKELLKEQRLRIGHDFVDEVRQRFPVLGHNFSGSMMTDMGRFGINSDLDIDLLINPADEKAEKNVFHWIHVYLEWKYAEEFKIKVDASDISLDFARMMASHESKFVDYFQREFGVDITKEIED